MKTYQIYGHFSVSRLLGEVQANSPEEAKEKADEELTNEMSISLCHQCAGQVCDHPQMDDMSAEEVE